MPLNMGAHVAATRCVGTTNSARFRRPSKNARRAQLRTATRAHGEAVENSRKRSGGLAFFDGLCGDILHGEGNSLSFYINVQDRNHHLLMDLHHIIGILHKAV
ncbi:MAG: hypothetical protein A4E62_02938 [Syntrophorhabdus sp. PtaU1.Bin002]|nr:MAG: hypothetical protein A4E58_00373 [Syntrophorhabdus sp. PtaB.Bin006]OPY63563.1 MAG: hypothetical protein A4E62_02938 [Syntrophorhabdus sp. PtaU1.Bin002]